MLAPPYINVKRIEFFVTHHCTGRCIHCSAADGKPVKDGHHHIEKNAAIEAVVRLSRHYNVDSVMTFGGEPMLYPDITCAIHSAAAGSGIKKRQVITNGYFSKDENYVRETAHAVSQSGINDLLLSVDAFHQADIPLKRVLYFARQLKAAGFEGTRLSPAWLVTRQHDNPYNRRTEAILKEFDGLGIPVGSGNDIFMAGNALKYLTDYYRPCSPDLSQACGSMPYTMPLTQVDTLSIDSNGDVLVCWFVIGNIYREDILDITARYDPYKNEYMRAIISGGVAALAQQAACHGVQADCSRGYSVCDICRRIADRLDAQAKHL